MVCGCRLSQHECAVAGSYSTFVITKTGDVIAWGLNNSEQLAICKEHNEDNLKWAPVRVSMGMAQGWGQWGCRQEWKCKEATVLALRIGLLRV